MRDSTRIGTVDALRMRILSRTTTFELDSTDPPLLTLDCKHEVGKMAPYDCKVQFLDDTDPFNSTSFPEPSRPPTYTFLENLPLVNQVSGLHKLLGAPHNIEDVALQLSHNGTYLDMESTLEEQADELEGFKDSRKNTIILRTQLSVRVHNIIAKLLSATGRDLRRALFSLKQIFQDDKDLVHEFVTADGLSCLITVGTDADQNYQNYILRAIGQIMLYVDGMNGVIQHNETIQWLYSLLSSKYRLVQKTSLKLLLVFVEYTENNSRLLWQAIQAVDTNRAAAPTRGLIDILSESDSGTDDELLVYALTLVNKVLYATPDQDTFYDVTDALEEQGMEGVMKKLLNRTPPNKDLTEQCNIYEASLKAEDGDENQGLYMAATGVRQRRSKGGKLDIDDGNRRRSRRHSAAKRMSDPSSAPDLRLLANGPHSLSDRVGGEDLSLNKQMSNSSPELDAKARRRQLRKERRMNRMSPLTNDSTEDSPKPEEESHHNLSRKTSLSRRERRERRQSKDSTEEKGPIKIYENGYPTSPAERKEFSPPVSPHSVDQRSPKISMRQRFDVDDTQPERKSLRDRMASSSSSNDAKTDAESTAMDRERNKKNAAEEQVSTQRKTSLDSSDSKRMMLRMFYGQSIDKGDSDTGGEGSSSSSGTVSSNHVSSNKIETGETINDRKTNLAKNAVKPEEEDKKQLETINEMKGIVGAKQNVLASKPQQEVAHSEPTKPSGDKSGLLSRMKNALTKQPDAHAESAQQAKAQEAARSTEDIELENRVLRSRPLKINEFDFTDLKEDDDDDVMSVRGNLATGPPPPPPGFGVPPPPGGAPPPPPGMPPQPPPPPGAPPPPPGHSGSKKDKDRKFVRLFWQEVRNLPASGLSKTIWCNLEPVDVDTRKLEHLFENRVKSGTLRRADSEEKMAKKEIVVLELKRAQAINIVLTKLPPIRAIKQAILDMDSAVIDREGIEKIMAMMPTEDEKTKIQEAQLQFPETPLAHAEHFLLTLASINELHARLNLWAFKLDYDNTEREIAEGLSDLKYTAEQLRKSATFKRILGTLLAIGCFLNGVKIKGFNLDYLAKVPEVRDTVHKQSLLYHLCCMVMEKFPESSDLYSELGSVHRASRCDFDNIVHLLKRLDDSCRRSWEYLRLIAKHDSSSPLKTKLTEFLADAGERIAILKVVHRRVHNRFRKLLVYLGVNARNAKETKPHEFCKVISEFSLEYRTVRQKVIEQKKKKENKRTRTKTRGKMITESENFTNATTAVPVNNKPETDVNMQAFHDALIGDGGRDSLKSASKSRLRAASTKAQQPASPVLSGSNAGGNYDTDDQTDQMMDMLVKSATSADKRTRIRKNRAKDSKSVRKSVRRTRTLKTGLTPEEVEVLQLNATG